MSTESDIKKIALQYFNDVGFASTNRPSTMDMYERWIDAGHHGSMDYLKRHAEKKANAEMLLPGARSWIALAFHYDTKEPLSVELKDKMISEKKGWIARYARGGDYHEEIGRRLEKMTQELKSVYPKESFLSCVDTKAVLERDVATRAGLGWVGKNTCLINQKRGSFFFLAEILTTLDLVPGKAVLDHCGTCTRCIDACPTEALVEPRKLDATKCISYWTIESRTAPPGPLAQKFGTQFFGCDICQDVCPWNQRTRKHDFLPEPQSSGLTDLHFFTVSSIDEIKDKIRGTAMMRAKPEQLRRNAQIVLENLEPE